MFSEVLAFHDALGTSSSSPAGVNQDWRGVMLCPGIGASSFTTRTAPNSLVRDRIPGCDTRIPANYPNRLACERNRANGFTWAAARSVHTGGVTVAMGDGSVRFVRDDVNPATWQALGSRAGGEVPGNLD
jgi:prepilin-type processing-associated H-X9-DG protein